MSHDFIQKSKCLLPSLVAKKKKCPMVFGDIFYDCNEDLHDVPCFLIAKISMKICAVSAIIINIYPALAILVS